MKTISIGSKEIGGGNPVFIIAEAGANHNGRLEMAKRLVDAAASAGVDAVKFQTFKAEDVATSGAETVSYMGERKSQLEVIKKYELKPEDFEKVKEYCDEKGIMFLTTLHSGGSLVEWADKLVPAFKIGSGDLTNKPFLEEVAAKGKPVLLATGMSTMDEVKKALEAIYKAGNRKVVALHCTTAYPCPLEEVNLNAMKTMRNELGCLVGYSDHTLGLEVPPVAVSLGAVVLEKHFTLGRNLPGPDHKASLEPKELCAMVESIRNPKNVAVDKGLEKTILGSSEKKPTKSELEMIKQVRKSIVAARAIPKGTKIARNMLSVKRPGTGISPMQMESILGKKAERDFKGDELIKFKDLRGS